MERTLFLLFVCSILFLPVDVKAGCNDTEFAIYKECLIVSEQAEKILDSVKWYMTYDREAINRNASYMDICARFFESDQGRINDCYRRRASGK